MQTRPFLVLGIQVPPNAQRRPDGWANADDKKCIRALDAFVA